MGKFSEELLDDDIILSHLNICIGQTILDAGCGNGYMTEKFSKLVGNSGKIYALDVDKGFIADLNKEETPFGPPVEMRSSPEELRQRLPFASRELIEVGDHFYMQLFEKI